MLKMMVQKSAGRAAASDLVSQVFLEMLKRRHFKFRRKGDIIEIDATAQEVRGLMDWVFHDMQADLHELQNLLPDSLVVKGKPVKGYYDVRVETGSSEWWGLYWARQLADRFTEALKGKVKREEGFGSVATGLFSTKRVKREMLLLQAKADLAEIRRATMVATNRVRDEMSAVQDELNDPGIQLPDVDPVAVASKSDALRNRTVRWIRRGPHTDGEDGLHKELLALVHKRFADKEATMRVGRKSVACPFQPDDIVAYAIDTTYPQEAGAAIFAVDGQGRVCSLNLATSSTEQRTSRMGRLLTGLTRAARAAGFPLKETTVSANIASYPRPLGYVRGQRPGADVPPTGDDLKMWRRKRQYPSTADDVVDQAIRRYLRGQSEAMETGYTVEGDNAAAAYVELRQELLDEGFIAGSLHREAAKRIERFDHPDGRVALVSSTVDDADQVVRMSLTVLTTESAS